MRNSTVEDRQTLGYPGIMSVRKPPPPESDAPTGEPSTAESAPPDERPVGELLAIIHRKIIDLDDANRPIAAGDEAEALIRLLDAAAEAEAEPAVAAEGEEDVLILTDAVDDGGEDAPAAVAANEPAPLRADDVAEDILVLAAALDALEDGQDDVPVPADGEAEDVLAPVETLAQSAAAAMPADEDPEDVLVLTETIAVPAVAPAPAAIPAGEDVEDVLVLTETVAVPAVALPPRAMPADEEAEDVLVLTETVAVPAVALPPRAMPADEEAENVLVLTETVAMPAAAPAPAAQPADEEAEDTPALMEPAAAAAVAAAADAMPADEEVEDALVLTESVSGEDHPGGGEAGGTTDPAGADVPVDDAASVEADAPKPTVPGPEPAPEPEPPGDPLALLLADPPPADDFEALDLLYAVWPRTTVNATDEQLLAVAVNAARRFGQPGRLPMTASRAWRMLDCHHFESAFATQLAAIGAFVRDWQKTHREFLILEFGEIELIELLFEALHPGRYADLLVETMDFKVLSNRRLGLLRRVPNRMRKAVDPLVAAGRFQEAMVELAHAKALLERISDPLGFKPIIDAASHAAEDVEKLMKRVAAASAPPQPPGPPGAGGGTALGRIG